MKRSVSFNIKPVVRLFTQISKSSPTLLAAKQEEEPVSPMPLPIGLNTAPDDVYHYDGRSWSLVKRSGCHAATEAGAWVCPASNTWVQPSPIGTSAGTGPLPPPPINLGVSTEPLPLVPLNMSVTTEQLRIKTPKLFPEQEPPPTPIYYDNSPLSPGAYHLIGLMREEEIAVRKEALASAVETDKS